MLAAHLYYCIGYWGLSVTHIFYPFLVEIPIIEKIFPVAILSGHSQWSFPVVIPSGHSQWSFTVVIPSGHFQWSFPVAIPSGHSQWPFSVVIPSGHYTNMPCQQRLSQDPSYLFFGQVVS